MSKRLSILFIFVLLFQTISSSLFFPAQFTAEASGKSVFNGLTVTDEAGQSLESDPSADTPLQLHVDWSVQDLDISEGSSETLTLPAEYLIQEDQSGKLIDQETDTEVGDFNVSKDGTITVTFNENIEEHANASGTFIVKFIAAVEEEEGEQEQASEEEVETEDATENETGEEGDKQEDSEENELETETDPSEEVTESETSEGDAATEETEEQQAVFEEGAEITENIITNAELFQQTKDGQQKLESGQEIVVNHTYDEFQISIQYELELSEDHGYGKDSTYAITLPDMLKPEDNQESTEVTAPDGTVLGSFTMKDGEVIVTFNENIEKEESLTGSINVLTAFDANYAGPAEGETLEFQVAGEETVAFPVKFIPDGKAIDKKGVYNEETNTIEWTVDFNKNLQTIEDAVLENVLEGDHAFKEDSLKVYKLHMNADGTIAEDQIEEVKDHEFGSEFPLELGDMDAAYRVVYETEITDEEAGENSYANKAILNGSNMDESTAEASVSVEVEGEETASEEENKDGSEKKAEDEEEKAGIQTFSTNADGAEITENLITDVQLSVTGGDGETEELDPGTPIRVEDPYNEFQVELRYEFELPNNHGYEAGATYTIEIPEMLTIDNIPDPTELRSPDGTMFGHFKVIDEQIIITFNENIEDNSNISGHIEAWSEFDAHFDGAADTELSFPVTGERDITFPIQFIPSGSSISKQGTGNKGYNTETIQWMVDFNKDFQEIDNAVLKDELTEGDHDYVPGSLQVYELELNADGTFRDAVEVDGYGDAFPLELGDIDSAYRVVYETKVNDREGTTYQNQATLEGENIDPVNASATVEVARGEALTKDSTEYDNVNQTITWEVKYNYDEKAIEQDQARLTDQFGENQELLSDSFEVYEVEINQNTGEEEGATPVSSNDYNVTPTDNGFEFQFNDDIDKAYKIIYKTTASERVIEDGEVVNEISDEFENVREGGQFVSQGVFIKSHDGDSNYDTKETSWTILINRDKQQMSDVAFSDTLPEGMSPKNVTVTHGGATLSEGTDYTYEYDADSRDMEIRFNTDITETVYITYDTDIDFDVVDWEDVSFTNTSLLEWIPENETDKITKEGTATFEPDEYTQHNGFKGASYNPVNKEITWTIGVNYNRASLEDVVVEDFIIGEQNFDMDNVKVYEMNLTGGEYGYEKGAEVENPTVNPATGPDGEEGFSIHLGNIDSPYIIEYTTDLNGQLIEGSYDNVAKVKTDNRGDSQLEASVEPYQGKEYTEKNASQNDYNPRVVNWNMDINFNQSTVTNLKIEDTPSINQAIRKDSFVLYGTTVTENGVTKDPNTILEEGKDYTLTFDEDEEGQETFTLEFLSEKIEHGYVLEYDTYILYEGSGDITNDAEFYASENIPDHAGDQFSQEINLSGISGGIDGEVGSLEVTKVDSEDDSKTLEGAVFELYDETGEVLLKTATTGENGVAEFKNLLYGDYVLKEREAPEYYVAGIEDQQMVNVNSDVTRHTVTNEKIKQHFELTKVDDVDGMPLEGVEFELYQGTPGDGSDPVGTYTTNDEGKILIEYLPGDHENPDIGLPAGDYYLIETTAKDHYELSTEPITFTINQDQTAVTTETVENKLTPGSANFKKVDSETRESLAGAVFDVIYVSYNGTEYNETVDQVRTNEQGKAEITDLRPGKYKLVENTPPKGYEALGTEIPFTIEESQETPFEIGEVKNDVKTTNLVLTKQDAVTNENLADAKFKLTYADGGYTVEDQTNTTNASGEITFEDLKPGTYELTEESTPEGYILNNEPIKIDVSLDDVHLDRNVNKIVQNDPFAHITLTKVDSESDVPLEGAEFKVTNEAGEDVLTELTSDENGRINFTGLPAGTYQLVETKAPYGYTSSSENTREFKISGQETETNHIEFTSTEDSALDNKAVENNIIKGSVELTKQDAETGARLEGVTFELQNISLVNGGTYETTTHTTDKDGNIFVDDLRPGVYKFVETEPKEGYQPHWKEIEFQINHQNEKHEREITVENHELVDIPVTKEWNDNNNSDNTRPESITVDILQNGTVLEDRAIQLNEGNNWQGTFEGLDAVDSDGESYEYTVEEQDVENYQRQDDIEGNPEDGFVITNVPLTSIDVGKIWKDEDPADREPVTIQLKRNADDDYRSIELDGSEDNQHYTFENLPVYDSDGDPYFYEAFEENPGEKYKSTRTGNNEDGYTFTNVRTGKKDIEVTKDWLDQEGTANRPDSISVQLFQKKQDEENYPETSFDDKVIYPDEDGNFEHVFEGVPEFDENGREYDYKVEEQPVNGYISTVDVTEEGFEITNVRTGTTSVEGTKIWNHDEGTPTEEVRVQLYQNDESVQDEVKTLSEDLGWEYEFTDLDKFDSEGIPYEYSVEEVDIPEGYESEPDGYDIINTRVGTTDLEVMKNWLDEDPSDRPDEIKFELYQNGNHLEDLDTTVTAEDSWTHEFENLPKFDEEGKAYTYTVEEVMEEGAGYEQVSNETNDDGSITITNVRTEEMDIDVTKKWIDTVETADRPNSITVSLFQVGEDDEQHLVDTAVIEPDSDGNWHHTFTNIDKFDEEGNIIEYTVEEQEVAGYQSLVEPVGEDFDNFEVTNVRTGTTAISGEKTWLDNDAADRPESITVQLTRSGDDEFEETVKVTEADNWEYSFGGLPRFNESGEAYEYYIDELTADENYEKSIEGYDITNTRIGTTSVEGTKTWQDENEEDRPKNITVILTREGDADFRETQKVTAENDWTYSFEDLEQYDDQGVAYEYVIDEEPVEGYEKQVNGYDITNTRNEQTSITVSKEWKDDENATNHRPDSITVELYRSDNDEQALRTKVIRPSDDWQHTFENLEMFDEEGQPYTYEVKELPVDGYNTNQEITDNGVQITNVREGKTSIDVTKHWNDNGDTDSRPEEGVEVELYRSDNAEEPIETATLTADSEWHHTFTDLEAFDEEGVAYEFEVKEKDSEGYQLESITGDQNNGFVITNVQTTEVPVEKVWEDDNTPSDRPEDITVRLLQNGSEYKEQTIKADDANNWKYTFENLPVYDEEGNRYEYTIEEIDLPNNYQLKEISGNADVGYVLTNVRVGETEVSGVKTWEDNNNQDGIRPNSINVNLLANGEKVNEDTVTADNDWKYSFNDLDKYDTEGAEINYTVTEDSVDHYSVETNDFNLTNSHTPYETSVTVTKHWDDNNDQDGIRPEKIEVQLKADEEEVGEPVELSNDNDWTYTWSELPLRAAGENIEYKVEEVTEVPGYQVNIDDSDHGNIILTNTHVPEVVEVSGTKTWNDANNQDGMRPNSVTVNLLADGEPYRETDITAANDWKYTFENLPKYNQGEEIEYTIEEVEVEGYDTTYDDFDITNTHEPEVIDIHGTKTWDDASNQDGIRPESIKVNLLANGKQIDSVEVTEADSWKYSFTDVPKYEAGEEIIYTVTENSETDYTQTIEDFDITNTYTPGKTGVTVTKHWDDQNNQDGIRPGSIEVQLTADGNAYGDPVELTEENNWTYTWQDLEEKADGEEIVYSVTESTELSEYDTTVNDENHGNITIINSYTPEVIDINGTKTWDDASNQDGIRPESIKVNLLANGKQVDSVEVTEADDWEYSFIDVPKYEAGEEIIYTVTESSETDYTQTIEDFDITNTYTPGKTGVTVTKHWDDHNNQDGIRPGSIEVQLTADGDAYGDPVELTEENNWTYTWQDLDEKADGEEIVYSVTESTELSEYDTTVNDEDHGNITITNSYTPEVIDINGTKTWDDARNQDGIRPESIKVNLLANGKQVDSVEVTEADDWEYSFTDVPKYEAGEEIEYTITEETVEGYETTYNGFNITNTHTPEVIDIHGEKTWKDAENQDGIRPDSITVNLLADEEQVQPVEVTEADDWVYSFTDLPKYKNGEEIKYSITEDKVEGYETTIDGYDITNVRVGTTSVEGQKTWIDDNSEDRLESIRINLLQNGEVLKTQEVTAEEEWTYSFDDLAKYDKNGVAYEYTVEEEPVEGYETTIDGYDITNIRVGTTSVEGQKTWIDDNSEDRPESIRINLLQNGEVLETQEVTAEEEWKYSFVYLPKYDDEGVANNYTIEEEPVQGYESTVNGYDITNVRVGSTSVAGEKIWKDDDAEERPDSVTVNLLQNGVVIDTTEVTAEDNWEYSFTDLAQYDEAGKAYNYTVTEQDVPGYDSEVNGYDITNTRAEQKSVVITKGWKDDNSENRPNAITVNLLQNGEPFASAEVTSEDEWTYEFENLEAYDENGVAYEYTVEEEPVEGYESTVEGYDITNVRVGTTSVEGQKTWIDDESEDRPDAITVNLLQNGEVVDTAEVTASDDWTYEFTDLKAYDEDGRPYTYTVEEDPVEGYATTINGYDITNVRQGTTTVEGEKIWQDDGSENRPDQIKVNLLQNGEVIDTTEVTAETDWQYSFTDLPEFDEAGVAYIYTVEEEEVPGYTTTVEGYNIINTLIPVEPEKEDPGETDDSGEPQPGDPGEPEEPKEETSDNEVVKPVDTDKKEETSATQVPDRKDEVTDAFGSGTADKTSGTVDTGEGGTSGTPETEEDQLPSTATNMYNILVIGIGLLLIGAAILLAYRRKIR